MSKINIQAVLLLKMKTKPFFELLANSEFLRILFLIAISCYLYFPFFSGRNIGADDAQYYLYMLHDFLVQIEAGIFPPYVTQSIYLPHGNPIILAPYYSILGSILNSILFLGNNILLTQHLSVIATATISSIFVYINLKSNFKSLSWEAAILSSLYIGSPAVMSLIYKMDMYLSFTIAPFIPIVFLQFLAIINSSKFNPINIILAACALSLTWMGHPPIAAWLSIVICMLCVAYIYKKYFELLLVLILFLLLSCWQLIPILAFRVDSLANLPTGQVDSIIQELKSSLPDSLFPLRQGSSGLFFLQLGYSLWFLLFLGGAISFINVKNLPFRILILIALLITLLLFPVAGFSVLLWNFIPEQLLKITYTWPNQRLYIILAALSCCIGAYFLDYTNQNNKLGILKKLSPILLAFLFAWSVYEAQFFISNSLKSNDAQYSSSFKPNSWEDSQNIVSFKHYLPRGYTQNLQYSESSNELAELNSRLLNASFEPIWYGSNAEFLMDYCENNGITYIKGLSNVGVSKGYSLSDDHFALNDGLNYVCISSLLADKVINFKVLDASRRQITYIGIKSKKNELLKVQNFGIPIFIDRTNTENSPFQLLIVPELPKNSLKAIKTISVPPNDNFPIKTISFTPYQSIFSLSKLEASYLEVDKAFFSGYSAEVDGDIVTPIKSKNESILIPLNKNKKEQIVSLKFTGSPLFKITYYVSLLTWIAVLFFLIFCLIKKLKINTLSLNN